jgi:DNA-binding NarL/FixJ family response regulator
MWPGFLTGQADQPVRVLLIDDDPHISRVIAYELLADLRIDLVGQGASTRDGRRLISQHDFDVMLVDLNLGDGTGFTLIEHLKTVRPAAEAIVISTMEDEQHALKAFELGATGYLVKNSWFGSFPQAVLQVVNGGASITPSLARRLLKRFEPAASSARAAPGNKQPRRSCPCVKKPCSRLSLWAVAARRSARAWALAARPSTPTSKTCTASSMCTTVPMR